MNRPQERRELCVSVHLKNALCILQKMDCKGQTCITENFLDGVAIIPTGKGSILYEHGRIVDGNHGQVRHRQKVESARQEA